ncbi:unnamed protein product, partial [Iphiclides podalirius]
MLGLQTNKQPDENTACVKDDQSINHPSTFGESMRAGWFGEGRDARANGTGLLCERGIVGGQLWPCIWRRWEPGALLSRCWHCTCSALKAYRKLPTNSSKLTASTPTTNCLVHLLDRQGVFFIASKAAHNNTVGTHTVAPRKQWPALEQGTGCKDAGTSTARHSITINPDADLTSAAGPQISARRPRCQARGQRPWSPYAAKINPAAESAICPARGPRFRGPWERDAAANAGPEWGRSMGARWGLNGGASGATGPVRALA